MSSVLEPLTHTPVVVRGPANQQNPPTLRNTHVFQEGFGVTRCRFFAFAQQIIRGVEEGRENRGLRMRMRMRMIAFHHPLHLVKFLYCVANVIRRRQTTRLKDKWDGFAKTTPTLYPPCNTVYRLPRGSILSSGINNAVINSRTLLRSYLNSL